MMQPFLNSSLRNGFYQRRLASVSQSVSQSVGDRRPAARMQLALGRAAAAVKEAGADEVCQAAEPTSERRGDSVSEPTSASGMTPLHKAARAEWVGGGGGGQEAVLLALLRAGASEDRRESRGWDACHFAAAAGSVSANACCCCCCCCSTE
jgi:hypothetical protein